MSSYFLTLTEAQRYSDSRINFHHMVVSKVVNYLKLSNLIPLILDVGCGTGQSTKAFAPLAQKIIGIDHSEAMLSLAVQGENISYQTMRAEEIDQLKISPDMIIAGQSFHWFDRRLFFNKVHQTLKPKGHLVIFTHALEHKEIDSLSKDFPQPFPTNNKYKEEAEIFGLIHRDLFLIQETICLTKKKIIDHLRTLSSVQKEFNRDSACASLKLAKYFTDANDDDKFDISSHSQIWILKRD